MVATPAGRQIKNGLVERTWISLLEISRYYLTEQKIPYNAGTMPSPTPSRCSTSILVSSTINSAPHMNSYTGISPMYGPGSPYSLEATSVTINMVQSPDHPPNTKPLWYCNSTSHKLKRNYIIQPGHKMHRHHWLLCP